MTTTSKPAVSNTQPDGKPFSLPEYLRGVKDEWKRISWPGRNQVLAETGVVLMVVTFFAIFVFLVDKIFQLLFGLIT